MTSTVVSYLRHPVMASIECRSLLQLPSSLWLKTCHFLEITDMLELCKIDVSFDHACREVLRNQEVTLEFSSSDLSPPKKSDVLPWRIYEALQLFGQYIHRVRFLIGNFLLHRETFEQMIPLLAQSPVLKSVHVKVQSDNGYIICNYNHEYTWTKFLCMCLEADKRRNISMSLTMKFTGKAGRKSNDYDNFFCLIDPLSKSSPCRFVSKLTIFGTDLLETEKERKSFPNRSRRIFVFLDKFSALKKLGLPLDYVTEAFLLRLSATKGLLSDLKVTNYHDTKAHSASQPGKVSRQTWDSVTAALPGLKVTCYFNTMDFDGNFCPVLRNIFLPNAPVSRVKLVSDDEEEINDILDSWCRTLDSFLDTVSAEMVTGDRHCPEAFVQIMQAHFKRNGFQKRTCHRKYLHNSGYCLHKITLSR